MTDAPEADATLTASFEMIGEGMGSESERAEYRRLKSRFDDALHATGAGEVDGSEFGEGRAFIFATGPTAAGLIEAAKATLTRHPGRSGGLHITQPSENSHPRTWEIDL